MYRTLRKIRQDKIDKAEKEGGFTLIELLVVVVIIGILVAIAIPLYLKYTQGANKRSAQSDVNSGVTAVQQGYSDNNNVFPFGAPVVNNVAGSTGTTGTAVTCANSGSATTACTKISLVGTSDVINVSPGNTLAYTVYTTASGSHAAGTFTLVGTDADGNQHSYDSGTGGSVG